MSAMSDVAHVVPGSGVGPMEMPAAPNMDLRSMLGVLLRRWRLCLAVPVLAVVLTSIGLSFVSPLYKSTVEILAADPKRQTTAADDRRLSTLDVDAAAMASEV